MDKIVTLGEILIRFSKQGRNRICQPGLYESHFGGSEANVAVSLAMLGDNVEFVSRLPKNEVGRACLMDLRQYNINLNHVVMGGDRLGAYYFEEAAALRNSLITYDREKSSFYSLEPGMIDWRKVFAGAKHFHCSGISCAISQSAADATFEAMEIAQEMGLTISFDINNRKNLWKYGANAHDTLQKLAQYSDIIYGDQGEFEILADMPRVPFEAKSSDYVIDMDSNLKMMQKCEKMYPKCKKFVLAMRNEVSSSHHLLTGLLYADKKLYQTKIYDLPQIVDPMGVGDALIAAYIHAYYEFNQDNQQCLDYALSASSLKNSIPGDFNLSSNEEILLAMSDVDVWSDTLT